MSMNREQSTLVLLTLFAFACSSPSTDPDDTDTDSPPEEPEPLVWDDEAAAIECSVGALDAPLLDAVLLDAGLLADEVGYSSADWANASYGDYLDDPFRLSWFYDYHFEPLRFSCFGGQLSADLDHAASALHPVATAIGEAMVLLDAIPSADPLQPGHEPSELVDLSGLPAELADALGPILVALERAAEARIAMEDTAPDKPRDLVDYGHGGVIVDYEAAPDLTDPAVQSWVIGESGPRSLYDPARVLAYAIEEAALERFAGLEASLDAETDYGRIIVAGSTDDAPGDIGRVAFYLDLGGDDTYVHAVAASSKQVPVSVHVDLAGSDTYSYVEQDDGTDALLPADSAGRYDGDDYYGPFSLSKIGRQGSGRFGVGMLFDFGAGDDHYQSLRVSQGWAHLGVGVLYDAGGDDSYLAEEGAQGAASMGIGLLLDGGGSDIHRSFKSSQGFGYVQAVGIAWDGGGDDEWYCNPGKTEDGGYTVYYSPQLPGNGNGSFCQGAGFGYRGDSSLTFLSGGLGVLRDHSGDDAYVAGVFGQGTGYWQGTGALLDGEGHDSYDAYWYVQGAAAHYAAGILLDDGTGDDAFNRNMSPNNMLMGAGHDFSVGLMANEAGDEDYLYAGLGAGASNCQGIGVMVDNKGSDLYQALSAYSTGLGNHSTECEVEPRTLVDSIGLFLDSGGQPDTYDWPAGDDRPVGDDASFGIRWHDTEDEHGGAVDGAGETGIHASGTVGE
jgi:hypothetical protein